MQSLTSLSTASLLVREAIKDIENFGYDIVESGYVRARRQWGTSIRRMSWGMLCLVPYLLHAVC